MKLHQLDDGGAWGMFKVYKSSKGRPPYKCEVCKKDITDDICAAVIYNKKQNLIFHKKCFKKWFYRNGRLGINLRI